MSDLPSVVRVRGAVTLTDSFHFLVQCTNTLLFSLDRKLTSEYNKQSLIVLSLGILPSAGLILDLHNKKLMGEFIPPPG